MKVIGAGFGRTGTMSLKAALEELGAGPCYHMVEVFHHETHDALWLAAARGERVDWRALLAGYASAVDWPASAFYVPLMETFPEAKIILTERDPDRWYDSVASTIFEAGRAKRRGETHGLMIDTLIWDGVFGGRFEDRAYAIDVFQRHNEEVKRVVPADRLLVFDVKQGWEPLARVLGVPVPADRPFPHLNDADSFRKKFSRS